MDWLGAYYSDEKLALDQPEVIRPGDLRSVHAPSVRLDVGATLGDVDNGCEPPVLLPGLLST